MFPSRQNTETSERQIQQVVWVLERAVDLMGPGTELVSQQSRLLPVLLTSSRVRTLALMIDYGEKGRSPPFSVSLRVILSSLPSIQQMVYSV